MGKLYILKEKQWKAKEETIKFLLDFSKSIEIITSSSLDRFFLISKN